MLINIKKTKSMLVVGKRIRKRLPIDMPILDINLNETKIEQVPNYKLLGVNLDQDLTYESHIDELRKKLSKPFATLRHISPYLRQNQKVQYYMAVIKPTLLYGCSVRKCTKARFKRRFSHAPNQI